MINSFICVQDVKGHKRDGYVSAIKNRNEIQYDLSSIRFVAILYSFADSFCH
jgi:hypothetical protein